MNLSESLRDLTSSLNRIALTEDKGHLDHPEDLIFLQGSSGATRALNSIIDTAKNPKRITIKFDGYPALIFGRDANGRFSIMDKHMFNKKDGTGRAVYSPNEFRQYDLNRGVDRSQLHALINEIWAGLEKASKSATGYFWGDLLFSQPLKAQQGVFKFKANPNGITYTVLEDSEVGDLLGGKQAGIAIHQFMTPDAFTTDDAQPLHGTIGQLQNNSNVAIVPSAMPNTPVIRLNATLVKNVQSALTKYRRVVDDMMNNAPQARTTFNGLFTVFINKKIVSGNLDNLVGDFMHYFENKSANPGGTEMQLSNHFHEHKDGLIGAFTIWIAVYQLKMDIVGQLNKAAEESPVKGYLDNGTETHEGFVSNGLKFVDRMGFSRQNLAGQR